MQNTIGKPAARITMPPQRFTVDSAVAELERKLKMRDRDREQKHMLIINWTAFPVIALIVAFGAAFKFQTDPQTAIMGGIVGGVFLAGILVFGPILMKKSGTPETNAMNDKREKDMRSVELSRKIASSLGESVIPVLTKEHVEAGLRFDKTVSEHGIRWTRENFHGIRSLLLEDLSREDAIIHLLTVRGITDVSEVRALLDGMDAVHKPLQDGWL